MPRRDMSQARRPQQTAAAIQLFASAPSEPRARRPVDGLRTVGYLLLLLAAALLSEIGSDLDHGLSEVLTSFPGFLKVLWLSGFWLAMAWSATLLVIAAFRQRLSLTFASVGAAALAIGISLAAAAIVFGQVGDVVGRLADSNGPPVFPPAALAITSAVIAVMAPYLTLPFRRFGRAVVAAQMLGSLFLGAAQTLGAITSLAIGLLAGTTIHLLRGSPGGFPTVARVRAALGDLGVDVEQLAATAMRREGVAVLSDGILFGPYYEGNDGTAIYNSNFRPFQSPVPFLFVRQGVTSDWKFFLDNEELLNLWARRFGAPAVQVLAEELRRLPWNARRD